MKVRILAIVEAEVNIDDRFEDLDRPDSEKDIMDSSANLLEEACLREATAALPLALRSMDAEVTGVYSLSTRNTLAEV